MKALLAAGAHAEATSDPEVVMKADKLVLPGVGHFSATAFLEEHGLKAAIQEKIRQGSPFLGNCVGLQWLCEGSTESHGVPGVGAFQGICERFASMKVPHVGWNSIEVGQSR